MALQRSSRQLMTRIAASWPCCPGLLANGNANEEVGASQAASAMQAVALQGPTSHQGGHALIGKLQQQQRSLSSNPVLDHVKGMRQALQLPPNPFTYRPQRVLGPREVLYRGRGMLLFRFLVRMKVFQLAGVFMVVMMLSMVMASDNSTPTDIAMAAAVALGCIVTSYCIWFYSGRYIGEMSLLLPERRELCISVLDFWGSRQDVLVPLQHLDAPFRNRSVAEVKAMVRPVLMPLKVKGGQEFYISMGHGIVLEEQVLSKILYGQFLEEPAEVPGGQAEGEQVPRQETHSTGQES